MNVAMTFFNPNNRNGSLHLEIIVPYSPTNERTILKIDKMKNSQEYEKYLEIFKKAWSQSDDAPIVS
ncbi:MAG: hypothetical protein WBK08_07790 [Nitrospira sp.]